MALTDKINDGFIAVASLLKTKANKTDVDKVVSTNTRLTTAKQTFPNVYVDSNGQLQKTQLATWLDHAKMYNGLFPNGSFQMGDATGWKLETSGLLTRDTTDFPFGAQACLRCAGATNGSGSIALTLDKIAVNPYHQYRYSAMFKYEKVNPNTAFYMGMAEYDVDGNNISAMQALHRPNTVTTLAQDLKVGDTKIYLTSLANWSATLSDLYNGIKFYTYKDSRGYLYDPAIMPYSRYLSPIGMWDLNAAVFDTTNNIITLNKPWNYGNPNDPQGIWRAGTKIAQSTYATPTKYNIADSFMYGQTGVSQWQSVQKTITGLDVNMSNSGTTFRAGTASIAPFIVFNYGGGQDSSNDVTKVSNLYFEKI
jgi:hypothetical protein